MQSTYTNHQTGRRTARHGGSHLPPPLSHSRWSLVVSLTELPFYHPPNPRRIHRRLDSTPAHGRSFPPRRGLTVSPVIGRYWERAYRRSLGSWRKWHLYFGRLSRGRGCSMRIRGWTCAMSRRTSSSRRLTLSLTRPRYHSLASYPIPSYQHPSALFSQHPPTEALLTCHPCASSPERQN